MSTSEAISSVRAKWIAAFIPVVCAALLMVRGEVRSATSTKFLVPISGYDPRDLLHGQYIQFRFDWNLDRADSGCSGRSCCLCLRGEEMTMPSAQRAFCDDESRRECDALIPARQAIGQQRYLVPEHDGEPLEQGLREHDATIVVECASNGDFALGELYLAGRPWRELVR